jgi:hypothetical protein
MHRAGGGGDLLQSRESMQFHDLSINDTELERFCQRNRIRELSFFGSITREDFRCDSDVDVLIEIVPPDTLNLLDLASLQLELTNLVGRQVHLHTPDMLHPYLRDRIRRQARIAYAA